MVVFGTRSRYMAVSWYNNGDGRGKSMRIYAVRVWAMTRMNRHYRKLFTATPDPASLVGPATSDASERGTNEFASVSALCNHCPSGTEHQHPKTIKYGERGNHANLEIWASSFSLKNHSLIPSPIDSSFIHQFAETRWRIVSSGTWVDNLGWNNGRPCHAASASATGRYPRLSMRRRKMTMTHTLPSALPTPRLTLGGLGTVWSRDLYRETLPGASSAAAPQYEYCGRDSWVVEGMILFYYEKFY